LVMQALHLYTKDVYGLQVVPPCLLTRKSTCFTEVMPFLVIERPNIP
jgi:hypothetical protein